ncbi:MAG: M61 family metallopeptidase [Bacteroidetes bacterium]|nr:M61 family metallopeptidase [Bacteroidota bacterium]
MTIKYKVSFPQPHDHLIHVEMTIGNIDDIHIDLKLPVWTPGSYLVREYAQHLEAIDAFDDKGKKLHIRKRDKNTWLLPTAGRSSAVVKYRIYAYDLTVRTNFVDAEHATVIGAATFLYVDGQRDRPATIRFEPSKTWKDIATPMPLKGKSKWIRTASCYDEIVDSPIQIGNHQTFDFKAGGKPHKLVVVGESNMDAPKLVKDLERICKEEVSIFGDIPCDEYLFILLNTENRYNGLEHLNSSLNQLPRWDYHPKSKYQRSMGLLSHEYFHLWNVKRIRPVELDSFNYDAENYSRQLWVVEGVTSYYDDHVLLRSKVLDTKEYLAVVAKMLTGVTNTPGDDVQSLTDASYDAWLKYYRRNPNSANNQVSYYNKGAMIIQALNLLIMQKTKGQRSFDDVMRQLWKEYKADTENGYTEEHLQEVVEMVAGISMKKFFKRHIYGTAPVKYAAYFKYAGLELVDKNKSKKTVLLGMTTKWEDGRLTVKGLNKYYGAYQSGLNVDDEIIAIDNYRVTKDYSRLYELKRIGDRIEVLINRQGVLMNVNVLLTANRQVDYDLVPVKRPGKLAKEIQKKWLGI